MCVCVCAGGEGKGREGENFTLLSTEERIARNFPRVSHTSCCLKRLPAEKIDTRFPVGHERRSRSPGGGGAGTGGSARRLACQGEAAGATRGARFSRRRRVWSEERRLPPRCQPRAAQEDGTPGPPGRVRACRKLGGRWVSERALLPLLGLRIFFPLGFPAVLSPPSAPFVDSAACGRLAVPGNLASVKRARGRLCLR